VNEARGTTWCDSFRRDSSGRSINRCKRNFTEAETAQAHEATNAKESDALMTDVNAKVANEVKFSRALASSKKHGA
jgi:hypothetical protein